MRNKRKSDEYDESTQQGNWNRPRMYFPSQIEETFERSPPVYYDYNTEVHQESNLEEEFPLIEQENRNTALVLYNPAEVQRQRLQSRLMNFIEYAQLHELQMMTNYLDAALAPY